MTHQDDGEFIATADLKPGMRVKITRRPWIGTILNPRFGDSGFTAVEEGRDDVVTSWAIEAIESIRRLPAPLPTTPGTWFRATIRGHADCIACVTPASDVTIATTPDGASFECAHDDIDPTTIRLIDMAGKEREQ